MQSVFGIVLLTLALVQPAVVSEEQTFDISALAPPSALIPHPSFRFLRLLESQQGTSFTLQRLDQTASPQRDAGELRLLDETLFPLDPKKESTHRDPRFSFVVTLQDQVVGLTYAARSVWEGHPLYLSRFAVSPAYQGTGLGLWLLYVTVQNAIQQMGHTTLSWDVDVTASRAHHFYRKIGAIPGEIIPWTTADGTQHLFQVYRIATPLVLQRMATLLDQQMDPRSRNSIHLNVQA